jgi:hypothetical protein
MLGGLNAVGAPPRRRPGSSPMLMPALPRIVLATLRPVASLLALTVLVFGAFPLARAAEEEPPELDEAPMRSWHFAEGNSGQDFQTFFSFLNLSDRPASVMAYYHRDDGIRVVQWLGIEPRARLSLNAREIVGRRAFGASFTSDEDIVVERSTTWGPEQNGETTLGFAPRGKRAWHFAEGTTRGLATTFFVVQNLSDAPARVTATFVLEDGGRQKRSFSLAPRARDAIRMNDVVRETAFGASFTSDEDVVVERTILSEGPVGVLGGLGYSPSGSEAGSRTWDFAEGSTRRPYSTYFVLFNPGDEATEVRFRFNLDGGAARTQKLWLPARGRVAFDPRDAVPAADFGTTITSDRPIVAERSYYSSGDGLYGALGYTPSQGRRDSRAWYFAEGSTTGQIETFFLVVNLDDRPAEVRVSLFADDAKPRERTVTVPARGRLSLRANDILSGKTFAARFLADRDIVVERTFYFPGRSGFTTVGSGAGRP